MKRKPKNKFEYMQQTEDLLNQRYWEVLDSLCADVFIEEGSIRIEFADWTWRYIEFPNVYRLAEILDYNLTKWKQ